MSPLAVRVGAGVLVLLALIALRGKRWAYPAFVVLGLLYFPAETGVRQTRQASPSGRSTPGRPHRPCCRSSARCRSAPAAPGSSGAVRTSAAPPGLFTGPKPCHASGRYGSDP